jgi:hypothetical protein
MLLPAPDLHQPNHGFPYSGRRDLEHCCGRGSLTGSGRVSSCRDWEKLVKPPVALPHGAVMAVGTYPGVTAESIELAPAATLWINRICCLDLETLR